MVFPFSVTPRLVAIAASGAIHATVFASLAFTTLTTPGGPRAVETIRVPDTREDVPAPPVVALPIEPVSNEANEASEERPALEAHRPPSRAQGTTPLPGLRASPDHDLQPRVTPEPEPHEVVVPLERAAGAPDFLVRFMMASPPSAANVVAGSDEGERGAARTGEEAAPGPRPETTYGEDDVSPPARLLSHVNAAYPMQAWASGVEADVPVEIVVDEQGSVASARVVTRAGHGFDDAALASIKSYRFAPAQRHGHAVRVRVRWSVQFRSRRSQ